MCLFYCFNSSCIAAAYVFSMATAGSSTGPVFTSVRTHESRFLCVRFSNLPRTTPYSREKHMIDQRFKRHDVCLFVVENSKYLPPMCFNALWEISEIYASVQTAAKKYFASHQMNLSGRSSKIKRAVFLRFVIEMLHFPDR